MKYFLWFLLFDFISKEKPDSDWHVRRFVQFDLLFLSGMVWSLNFNCKTSFLAQGKSFANKIRINYEKLEQKRCENLNFPPSNFAHIVCIKKYFIVSLAFFHFCCVRSLLPLVN